MFFVRREEFAFLFQTFSRSDPPGKAPLTRGRYVFQKKKKRKDSTFGKKSGNGPLLFPNKRKLIFSKTANEHLSVVRVAIGEDVMVVAGRLLVWDRSDLEIKREGPEIHRERF